MSNLREDLFYFDEDENENENNPESQAPPINPKTFRNTSPNKPSIIGEATRITKSIFTRDIDGDEDQYQHQRGQKYSSPKQKTTKNDPLRTTNITKYATEKLIEDQKQHKVVEEKSHPPELPLEEFLIPNFSDNQEDEQNIPQPPQPLSDSTQRHNSDQEHLKTQHHDDEEEGDAINRILFSEITNMKEFLKSPVEKGKTLQCTILRKNTGFNLLFPEYSVFTSEGLHHLMTTKKQSGNTTSNYLISMDRNDMSKGNNFIGKLRSNWMGTEYVVYDNGCKPGKQESDEGVRRTLVSLYYQTSFLKDKGPKRFDIYIPSTPGMAQPLISLKQLYSQKKGQVLNLKNMTPRFNPSSRTYSLNFRGRVNKASVKNFILHQHSDESQREILLFGKMSDNEFHMDVSHPLSPLQALGIVLSCFDYKLGCE